MADHVARSNSIMPRGRSWNQNPHPTTMKLIHELRNSLLRHKNMHWTIETATIPFSSLIVSSNCCSAIIPRVVDPKFELRSNDLTCYVGRCPAN